MTNMFPMPVEPGFQELIHLVCLRGPCAHTSTVRVPLGLGVWIYRCWGLTGRSFGQTESYKIDQPLNIMKCLLEPSKYQSSVALEL